MSRLFIFISKQCFYLKQFTRYHFLISVFSPAHFSHVILIKSTIYFFVVAKDDFLLSGMVAQMVQNSISKFREIFMFSDFFYSVLSLTRKNICNLIGWGEYNIGRICTLFSIIVLFDCIYIYIYIYMYIYNIQIP